MHIVNADLVLSAVLQQSIEILSKSQENPEDTSQEPTYDDFVAIWSHLILKSLLEKISFL